MTETFSCRLLTVAILASALSAALCGCSNRAHTDLYQQRMASEIRVLEDQLYEADYQNRVLQDKLASCQTSKQADCAPTTDPSATPQPHSTSPLDSAPVGDIGMDYGLETELELPSFDTGVPVEPEALPVPNPSAAPSTSEDSGDTGRLLPAPGGPEPPGKNDTTIPQVDPGHILPPPAKEEGEIAPPGQINLPDSVQAAAGVPEKLRLHGALSGGHRIDGKIDGMMIVVNVVDKFGKTVTLDNFDIDADLSIVIMDPDRESDEARIGRWDFPSDKVARLIQSEPISGFHVPVEWKEASPTGDEVIVHVRLRAEEDELRCEGRLKVEKTTAIAEWTPRGDERR